MFENILNQLLIENQDESGGALYCLPLSRALLDALELLGVEAKPLVIRGVVFGEPEDPEFFEKANVVQLVNMAFHGPRANGWMDVGSGLQEGNESKPLRLHYRTIGQPHSGEPGDQTLGNYDENGKWLGHLVVVANGVLLDPSIGQLNADKFRICFAPPGFAVPVSDEFLAGDEPLVFFIDGMLVAYFAYPDETTFEASKSWNDPEFRGQLKRLGERAAAPFNGKAELHHSD